MHGFKKKKSKIMEHEIQTCFHDKNQSHAPLLPSPPPTQAFLSRWKASLMILFQKRLSAVFMLSIPHTSLTNRIICNIFREKCWTQRFQYFHPKYVQSPQRYLHLLICTSSFKLTPSSAVLPLSISHTSLTKRISCKILREKVGLKGSGISIPNMFNQIRNIYLYQYAQAALNQLQAPQF